MFGHTTSHVPDEVVLHILRDHALDFFDLLRCATINKRWKEFIYGYNEIRERLFLPRHDRTGIKMASSHQCLVTDRASALVGLVHPHVWLQRKLNNRCEQSDLKKSHWNILKLHPILESFRGTQRRTEYWSHSIPVYPRPRNLELSYRLLYKFNHQLQADSRDTWRDMFLTRPPIGRLRLKVICHPCNSRRDGFSKTIVLPLHDEGGIKIGALIDALESTPLLVNSGLTHQQAAPSIP